MLVEKGPILMLTDGQRENGLSLQVNNVGSKLTLDDGHQDRVSMGLDERSVGLDLFDEQGRPIISVYLMDETPGIVVADKNGEPIWHAPW